MPTKKPFRVILDPPFEPTIPREVIRRAIAEVMVEDGAFTGEEADAYLEREAAEDRKKHAPGRAA